jgi:hypothetical protein
MAGIGYVFQIDVMMFLFINLGVGGAIMTLAIASIRLFKQLMQSKYLKVVLN